MKILCSSKARTTTAPIALLRYLASVEAPVSRSVVVREETSRKACHLPSSRPRTSAFSFRPSSTALNRAPTQPQQRCFCSNRVSNDTEYRLPNASFFWKVHYVRSIVPEGLMDSSMIEFCLSSIQNLCKDKTSSKGNKKTKKHLIDKGSIERAEELLKRLEKEAMVVQQFKLSPTPYNHLIRGDARTRSEDCASRSLRLLERMQKQSVSSEGRLPAPNVYTYDAVLYACTTCPHMDAPAIAENVLQEMKRLAEDDPSSPIAPTVTSYNNVIMAYANQASTQYGAAANAEDWLMHLSDLSTTHTDLFPTTRSFNHVLQAWCTTPEKNGADRALQILNWMISTLHDDKTRPDVVSFGTVIQAFGLRKRPHDAELVLKMALDYFVQFLQNEDEDDVNDKKKDAVIDLTGCLNVTLLSWSRSGDTDEAVQHAKDLLDDAYTLSTDEETRLVIAPDATSHLHYLTTILNNIESPDTALDKATKHLYDMIRSFQDDQTNTVPDAAIFHTIMKAWGHSERHGRAKRVSKLLDEMLALEEQTDKNVCRSETFDLCLDIWYKSEGEADRIREMLSILDLADQRLATSAFSYHCVINALCREGREDYTMQALRVIRQFERQCDLRKTFKWNPRENIGLYTTVIGALGAVRTQEAANLAFETLLSIPRSGKRRMRPTSRTYTSVIVALSRIGTEESAQKVVQLFEKMLELDNHTNCKIRVDNVVFGTVLHALSRARYRRSAADAHKVMKCMLDLQRSGRKDVTLDEHCVRECFHTLQRNGDKKSIVDLAKVIVCDYQDGVFDDTAVLAVIYSILAPHSSGEIADIRRQIESNILHVTQS